MSWEVAFENCAFLGNSRFGADRPAVHVEIDNAVDELEILNPHAGSSGPLGGNKTVDSGAQVLQDEILLGRRLAVVDLLGPLLQRELDPKGFIDGKRNIEEVQAIDSQVLDGVTLRLDAVTRDVTGFGDDVGHGIERRRHSNPLTALCF